MIPESRHSSEFCESRVIDYCWLSVTVFHDAGKQNKEKKGCNGGGKCRIRKPKTMVDAKGVGNYLRVSSIR